ncbi:MAG TPA: trigger factor, partial [Dehalococcoidia bacterium]|nr:trigger factor [Dehalococcoidia bacterium]
MKISTEKIPEAQVVMTIEVESERLDKAREKAVRKLSPKAKVPGFRPGKAPAAMVRRYFGEERILDEALDDLVPDVYREAMEQEQEIVPIARPRLVVETTEPLVVKATIPVRPTVELGDYQSVRVATEEVSVEESRVDDTLLALQRRAATLEPVEREIGWRDIVRLDVQATVDGETLIEQQEAEIQLVEGHDVLFDGFEEQLLGKKKDDEFDFDLATPDTLQDPKFAGKQAQFRVKILDTKE